MPPNPLRHFPALRLVNLHLGGVRASLWIALCAGPLSLGVLPMEVQAEDLIEEVTVVGKRDLSAVSQSSSAEVLRFDDQVSLNRTVGDWIESVPGVSLNGQGGLFQAYSVRGFSRWRLRTELDGIPIITDRRAGNSVAFAPPGLLARVSVEKDAASSLFGSGAMGGVVSLESAKAQAPELTVEGRSNDKQLAVSLLTGDDAGRSYGLSLRRAEDGEAPDGSSLNTAYEQVAGLISGDTFFGVNDSELELRYRWVPSVGRDIGKSNRLFPQRRLSDYPEEAHSAFVAELRQSNRWFLRAYHHYQNWQADVARLGERRNLTDYQAHTVGGLFSASLAIGEGRGAWGLEWVGRRGVSIADREYDQDDILLLQQSLVDAQEDTLGAFIDQSWSLGDLRIGAGLRLDYVRQSNDLSAASSRSDSQFSGNVRAAYQLAPSLELRAELASGYRFPGVSERFFNGVTPRGEIRGNPQLAPETRRNVDFSVAYQAAQLPVSITASAYYSDLDNYIERFAIDASTLGFRNLDSASLMGGELDLSWGGTTLTHRVSYQYQRGDDQDGNTLADLNPPGWRYFLRWQGERYALFSDLSYRNDRDDFGQGEQPIESAVVWNARITQTLARRWVGELFVTNILDEAYRGTADDLAPLQPGRTVGLRLTWQGGA